MPSLDTTLHVQMLQDAHARRQPERDGLYGLHWGDPDADPALRYVRDHFLWRHVHPDRTAVEIGPGGGRWTRYMLGFGRLYVVDLHQELLDELARRFRAPQLVMIRSGGTDFPGVPDASVDFLFSFGVFVHLDFPIVEAYLDSMRRVLRPGADVVLQYADKTKPAARANVGFAENTPDRMRAAVLASGYDVLEENLTSLPHSSVIRFRR